MGIKTTRYLDRNTVENRILEIDDLLASKDFNGIESVTCEHDFNLEGFVNTNEPLFVTSESIELWTDTILENQVDKPFYRFSMFDNYFIGEESV